MLFGFTIETVANIWILTQIAGVVLFAALAIAIGIAKRKEKDRRERIFRAVQKQAEHLSLDKKKEK